MDVEVAHFFTDYGVLVWLAGVGGDSWKTLLWDWSSGSLYINGYTTDFPLSVCFQLCKML